MHKNLDNSEINILSRRNEYLTFHKYWELPQGGYKHYLVRNFISFNPVSCDA